jgi:hypothetical protein
MKFNDKITEMSTSRLSLFWALFVWNDWGGAEIKINFRVNTLYVNLKEKKNLIGQADA